MEIDNTFIKNLFHSTIIKVEKGNPIPLGNHFFFINNGKAKSADIEKLIKKVDFESSEAVLKNTDASKNPNNLELKSKALVQKKSIVSISLRL